MTYPRTGGLTHLRAERTADQVGPVQARREARSPPQDIGASGVYKGRKPTARAKSAEVLRLKSEGKRISDNLTLLGQYGANFSHGADAHLGTLITDPRASSSVAQMPLVAHH
jgi:hypothetical protein